MPKINTVAVDEKGNLKVEFSCYEGIGCEIEEDRLRRSLAELGLAVTVDSFERKTAEQIQAEVKGADPGRRRRKVEV